MLLHETLIIHINNIRMQNEFKEGWFFTRLGKIKSIDDLGTYFLFEYEKLPKIDDLIADEKFEWLKRHPPKTNNIYIRNNNYDEQLKLIDKEIRSKELKLPNDFIDFTKNINLIKRIRSNTSCIFKLGNKIEEISQSDGLLYAIQFLVDSQNCRFWYLCLTQNGINYILTSDKSINSRSDYIYKGDIYLCAYSFREFISRFCIENEIWFKKVLNTNEELNETEKNYLTSYNSSIH